jgi:hypothetical protein
MQHGCQLKGTLPNGFNVHLSCSATPSQGRRLGNLCGVACAAQHSFNIIDDQIAARIAEEVNWTVKLRLGDL